jgi:hypothetical protein
MRIIIQDVRHLKLKQDFLWVGTVTLVTVILWIAYAIYAAFQQSTVDPEIVKLTAPLNPTLDQTAISIIDNRYRPPTDFAILVYTDNDPNTRSVVALTPNPVFGSNQTDSPSSDKLLVNPPVNSLAPVVSPSIP